MVVRDPTPCVGCQAQLQGLNPDLNCPDCGRPIADSLAPAPAPASAAILTVTPPLEPTPIAAGAICQACGYSLEGLGVGARQCPECGAATAIATPEPQWQPISGEVPAPVAPEPPFIVVDEKRPCLGCGYDLINLAANAQCPECGTPVLRSIRGNLLRFASTAYLLALRRGSILIIAGMILALVGGTLGGLGAAAAGVATMGVPGALGWIQQVTLSLALAFSFVLFAGWFVLTTPDPGQLGDDTGKSARVWTRISVLVQVVVALCQLVLELGFNASTRGFAALSDPVAVLNMGLAGVGYLTSVGMLVAGSLYLRGVSRRIPDTNLVERFKLFAWLLPVLSTVGAIFCGLGPLVAQVLLIIALVQVIRLISPMLRAAQDAERNAAPAAN